MIEQHHWDKQLPYGVADLFFEEAAGTHRIEERLCETFSRWGYSRIIPPTFEYYESLATEAGAQLQEEMYRFFDREGRTLALRADLTIPTARIVGTKLYDQPLPLRFFYAGNVFRYEEPQAGRRREFHQAGVELIGASNPQADAEVLALLVQALQAVGLTAFQIDVGQVAFFKGLLQDAGLHEEERQALIEAIQVKDHVTLRRLLETMELNADVADKLAMLPSLQGGMDVFERARGVALNPTTCEALDQLEATCGFLQEMNVFDHFRLDLAQLKGMEYYTGLMFQVFVPGVGFSICGGGRYDDLVAHFGPSLPAVGFALGVERLLLALREQDQMAVDIMPEALIDGQNWIKANELADALRDLGLRIEVDVRDRDAESLVAYARDKGVSRVVLLDDKDWHLVEKDGSRVVSSADLVREAQGWRD